MPGRHNQRSEKTDRSKQTIPKNKVNKLEVSSSLYLYWISKKGGIIDDLIIIWLIHFVENVWWTKRQEERLQNRKTITIVVRPTI